MKNEGMSTCRPIDDVFHLFNVFITDILTELLLQWLFLVYNA